MQPHQPEAPRSALGLPSISEGTIWRYPRSATNIQSLLEMQAQGKIAKINLSNTPGDQILPGISKYLHPAEGWSSPVTFERYSNLLARSDGPIDKLCIAMLDQPRPETEEAFEMFGNIVFQNPLEKGVLNSPADLRAWIIKHRLATRMYAAVGWKAELSNGRISPQADRFASAGENETFGIISFLDSLTIDDLAGYISYTDIRDTFYAISIGKAASSQKRPKSPVEQALDRALNNINQKITTPFMRAETAALVRLQEGWGQKQFQEVLNILPSLQGSETKFLLMGILQAYFEEGFQFDGSGISSDVLNFLIKFNWSKQGKANKEVIDGYGNQLSSNKNDFKSQQVSMPQLLFPTVAFELLRGSSGNILAPIERLGNLGKDPDAIAGLTKLLFALKGQPDISGRINQILQERSLLPARALQIAQDKKAGSIWITEEGRIKIADYATTSVRGAFLLYRNNIQTEQAEPALGQPARILIIDQPEQLPQPENPEAQKTIDVERSITVPLWGRVGVATQTVDAITEKLAERVWGKDWNQLGTENDTLQNRWMVMNELPEPNTINPNLTTPNQLLHVRSLHDVNRFMRAASEIGVAGVSRMNNSDFLVIVDMLANLKGDTMPLALRADLRRESFKIHGTEDAKMDMYWYMVLHNLILNLATSSYQLQPANTDQEAELDSIIAQWNRGRRNDLGRIRKGGNNPIIPVYLKQAKTSILVSSA